MHRTMVVDVFAVDYCKLTKTIPSLSNNYVTLNWSGNAAHADQYYAVLDTVHTAADQANYMTIGTHTVVLLSNYNLDTVQDVYNALKKGDVSLTVSASTSNSITLQSTIGWPTSGPNYPAVHTLTVVIAQAPDTSDVGSVWLS